MMDGTLGEGQWDTFVHKHRRWRLVMYPSPHRHRLETSLHSKKDIRGCGQPLPYHLEPPKLGADNIGEALERNNCVCYILFPLVRPNFHAGKCR